MHFLSREILLGIHDAQLANYGGLAGVRDDNLLESALARPQNRYVYGDEDLYTLAASLAYGLARNHPFLDGNKRSALHAALTFLSINGAPVPPASPEMVEIMVQVAEGSISEDAFAAWLRQSAAAKKA